MDGKSVFGYKPRFFFNLNLEKTYIISIMRSCLNAPTHTYFLNAKAQNSVLGSIFHP